MYLVETLPRLQSVQVTLLTTQSRISLRLEGIHTSCNNLAATDCDPGITITNTTVLPSQCTYNVDLSQLDLSSFTDVRMAQGVLRLRFKTKSSPGVVAHPGDFLEDYNDSPPSELALACAFCGLNLTRKKEGAG